MKYPFNEKKVTTYFFVTLDSLHPHRKKLGHELLYIIQKKKIGVHGGSFLMWNTK